MSAIYSLDKFEQGQILLINKEINWTSFDVVKKIKNLISKYYNLKTLKIGHAGTLDPLATGLILICTGKETKKMSILQEQKKEYIAEITLGNTTPSFDLETEINNTYPINHIDIELINETIKKFKGKIKQVPPLYSAKWLGGKRAYEFARKGKKINLEPIEIKINEIKIISFELPKLILKIQCSKGTYIRSLAHDIGKALKSGAYLSRLTRTAIGNYKLEDAIKIKDFERNLILNITN